MGLERKSSATMMRGPKFCGGSKCRSICSVVPNCPNCLRGAIRMDVGSSRRKSKNLAREHTAVSRNSLSSIPSIEKCISASEACETFPDNQHLTPENTHSINTLAEPLFHLLSIAMARRTKFLFRCLPYAEDSLKLRKWLTDSDGILLAR